MKSENLIICPCCENAATLNEWLETANDEFLPCPVCKNVCTYNEFENGIFNNEEAI